MTILVIDDETSLRRTIRITLESMGHDVLEAANGTIAVQRLEENSIDVAFLDLKLAREDGLALLPNLLAASPSLGVFIITANASIGSAVEAMRNGAFDYIPKPFTPDQLRVALERWSTVRGLKQQVAILQEQVRRSVPDTELTTLEPKMKAALDLAFRVAETDATLLIRGESGTGKGVLARTVHSKSRRSAAPFVVVHCPSLSAELLESDLFGHTKGAFTGAVTSTEGKVAAAHEGTLFLDEIGDLPLALQPKLLRFLQDKQYERVGETRTRTADVRLLAATNRDLEAEVKAGRFREDLFYRFNVIEVTLPPLRERPHDLVPLSEQLVAFFARQFGRGELHLNDEAKQAIRNHTWPGNVRELRNAIERGVILATDSSVGVEQLPQSLVAGNEMPGTMTQGTMTKGSKLEIGSLATLEEIESEHMRQVLARAPSLEDAATILGIDASTLYRKRRKMGL
ncbi:MAG: sigma-54 dependent transcriptional regulator [Gemmataceae bacterium]